jgi:hypothetical protein
MRRRSIKIVFTLLIAVALAGLTFSLANAQPQAIAVPWYLCPGGGVNVPHSAYNGHPTTFKAIVRGGVMPMQYQWDFNGDGIYDTPLTNVTDPFNLQAIYTYPNQAFTNDFVARVRVVDNTGAVSTDEYFVTVWVPDTREVRVNVAIDDALWYLHNTMHRYSSGGIDYMYSTYGANMVGYTSGAIQSWENQGHRINGNYNEDPYVEDVRRGINYVLTRTFSYSISTEIPAYPRNPDLNGNGIGLVCYVDWNSSLYETGMALMAIASCGDSNYVAPTGGANVIGRRFIDIAQDIVEFLSFAQVEPTMGNWRGGWRYYANYSSSDMSNTQFPVIGIEAAESNWPGVTVPSYVKPELRDRFLLWIQNASGGFGYTSPGEWVNDAKTGAGLACLAWTEVPVGDNRVTRALNYLCTNWNSTTYDYGNFGDFYAMYAVMKGMRGYQLDSVCTHNWYYEYADWLVSHQLSNGSWSVSASPRLDVRLGTAFAVLILSPSVFEADPVAVAEAVPNRASPGDTITFDHSNSYHKDCLRTLVLFEWDWESDGVYDYSTGDMNDKPVHVYTPILNPGDSIIIPVTLRVTDDVGKTDLDNESVVLVISRTNHPPVADANPFNTTPAYTTSPGVPITLDGSQSYDPDWDEGDSIIAYNWDTDNDGFFGAEDTPPDYTGKTVPNYLDPNWTFGNNYTVSLRVTDDGTWDGIPGNSHKQGFTTVLIYIREVYNAKVQILPAVWYTSWGNPHTGRVRCWIGEIEGGYDVNQIQRATVRLNATVPMFGTTYRILPSWPGFNGSVLEVAFDRYSSYQSLGLITPGNQYPVKITGQLVDGANFEGEYMITVPIAAPKLLGEEGIPESFSLIQNYPNPFNPETDISYALPSDCQVKLTIYNLLGQKVKTLVNEPQTAGYKSVHWNGKDEQGNLVASGIYFYKLNAGEYTTTKKMVMTK